MTGSGTSGRGGARAPLRTPAPVPAPTEPLVVGLALLPWRVAIAVVRGLARDCRLRRP